jgi:hypothetical protein
MAEGFARQETTSETVRGMLTQLEEYAQHLRQAQTAQAKELQQQLEAIHQDWLTSGATEAQATPPLPWWQHSALMLSSCLAGACLVGLFWVSWPASQAEQRLRTLDSVLVQQYQSFPPTAQDKLKSAYTAAGLQSPAERLKGAK